MYLDIYNGSKPEDAVSINSATSRESFDGQRKLKEFIISSKNLRRVN